MIKGDGTASVYLSSPIMPRDTASAVKRDGSHVGGFEIVAARIRRHGRVDGSGTQSNKSGRLEMYVAASLANWMFGFVTVGE